MSAEQVASFNNEKTVQQSEGTEGERSFGLGLIHVQQLVSEIHGDISVVAEIDKETTYSVSIPLSR
jgi:sensor histidine kinase regulating citrate/malate metabolism